MPFRNVFIRWEGSPWQRPAATPTWGAPASIPPLWDWRGVTRAKGLPRTPGFLERGGADPREGKGHTCLVKLPGFSGTLSFSLPGIPGQMLLSEAHWGAWLKKRSPTCILSLATISTRFDSPPSHLQQSGSLLRHLNGEWTTETLVWKLPGNPLQPCLLLPLRTREQDSGIR